MIYSTADQAFLERRKDGSFPDVIYRCEYNELVRYTPSFEAASDFVDILGRREATAGAHKVLATVRR